MLSDGLRSGQLRILLKKELIPNGLPSILATNASKYNITRVKTFLFTEERTRARKPRHPLHVCLQLASVARSEKLLGRRLQ